MFFEHPFSTWKQVRRHGQLNFVITVFLVCAIGILLGQVGALYLSSSSSQEVEQYFFDFPIYCVSIAAISLTVSLAIWYLCELLYKSHLAKNKSLFLHHH